VPGSRSMRTARRTKRSPAYSSWRSDSWGRGGGGGGGAADARNRGGSGTVRGRGGGGGGGAVSSRSMKTARRTKRSPVYSSRARAGGRIRGGEEEEEVAAQRTRGTEEVAAQ
jgi:hypothetical protein